MPRYRFSETVIYKSGNPWTTYAAGEVYDLPANHGERWVRRQVAVEEKEDSAAALDAVVVEAAAGITEAVESGEKSINQAREELGMPPIAPVVERTTRPYRTRGGA